MSQNTIRNCVYILTCQQYPGYVKIGYASDLRSRLSSLNTSMMTPLVPYAVYETDVPCADLHVHRIIGLLNPALRAARVGPRRVSWKEFFKMEPEEAYCLLTYIAAVSGELSKVYRVTPELERIAFAEAVDVRTPVGVRFLANGEYRPFTSLSKLVCDVCDVAITLYGQDVFEEAVFDMDIAAFHGKTCRVFQSRCVSIPKHICRPLGDKLFLVTGNDEEELRRIIAQLIELFPDVVYELVYEGDVCE